MDLKVIVVTYNSAPVLPGLIESLRPELSCSGSNMLIIVDNGSSDTSLCLAHSLAPDATAVSLDENRGFAAGINAGVETGPPSAAVLILNPDVRLQPGALRGLLKTLSVPGTGIAVPKMLDGDGRLSYSLRRDPSILRALGEALLGGERAGRYPLLGELVCQPDCYSVAGNFDWATGAAMAISRECLEAVGPWDESFFLYSEETDFALRARDAGFALRYTPDSVVVHLGGTSSPRLRTIRVRNRIALYRRRHGSASTALFLAAVALNEALRALSGSPAHAAALRALLRFPGRATADAPLRRR